MFSAENAVGGLVHRNFLSLQLPRLTGSHFTSTSRARNIMVLISYFILEDGSMTREGRYDP